MKKKIMCLIICLSILLLTACDGDVTRALRHDGFALSGSEFICTSLTPLNDKDTNYTKIKYLASNFAVLEDGSIYDISLSKVYANKENCKKSTFTGKVVAIFDDTIIKASDNKFYYTSANTSATPYSEVTENDNNYQILSLLFSDSTVTKVETVDSNTGSYYVLKTDGNVYNYIITRADYNSPYAVTSNNIIYSKINYGSNNIIDFNYSSSTPTATYVKTSTSIYRTQATNKDKCTKYADVTCTYKMSSDDTLNKYSSKILYFGPTILITTYKKEFTIAS